MSDYRLRPEVKVGAASAAVCGWAGVLDAVRQRLSKIAGERGGRLVLAIECYPGTNVDELREGLVEPLGADVTLLADDFAWDASRVQGRIADTITDDRVFGILSHYTEDEFFDADRVGRARADVLSASGLAVVYGVGATVICPDPDLLLYADLTRWEIQLRLRAGMPNWKANNAGEDALRKFKRGYFFEWRMADLTKRALFDRVDFELETNVPGEPKMVPGDAYRAGLAQVARQPFRLVPYFDTSVWGGHWMQERFGLDPDAPNFGWAFDGVPEENSVILDYDGVRLEIPAINIVLREPDALLGPKVHARFGAEFPIRFDYLDTMGGQNLSLQVHPLVEYAQDKFGIHYTQDESYYILDASEDSCVYLGVKPGVSRDEMVADLKRAERGEDRFHDESFVNRFPVRKHDHVMIPAGTVHCAGPDTVVLEISATPYIFTFKLWDWGRVGLDGIPRPLHIDHGAPNIRLDRDTDYALSQLLDRADDPHQNLSDQEGVVVERTGLHELEFIETHRHWFTDAATVDCHQSVNMLNLVEGTSTRVVSLDGGFEPFDVYYGETFIVPESVERYRIENTGDRTRRIGVIQAFVRNL
ncbi:class I mannose-6-phosphate isomerase [Olsenella sp. DNF00959]|uniref:class I mannose-6-phosphate isomerase n=1 Tax=Olsenella sp. DNF00959 TaxID=1476999 RepID=UPI000784AAD0|nr:class I mannose-6-phosphate isomerase [Olsenella sp. DNF00959]KXB62729.1 putative mannose-6-phosphate isomerase, class I [Olsenella sp. DNF00959]